MCLNGADIIIWTNYLRFRNLPNGFRRPSPRKKLAPATPTEDTALLHGSLSAFVPFKNVTGACAVHESDEQDVLEVDQLLSHRSPRKRAGKRMSTWSVVGDMEAIAISSDEASELEIPLTPTRFPTNGKASQPTFPNSSTSGGLADRSRLTLSSKDQNSEIPKMGVMKKRAQQRNATNLAEYALDLYNSLNYQVFGNKLPQGCYPDGFSSSEKRFCEIIWSRTLMTTAGRAVIKR